jgi:lipoate-protein ligase A
LSTKNLFIYSQLQYEEAILRLDEGSWCFINEGSPKAAVLGLSQKPEEELAFCPSHIPIIKRFSGGGSVLVDENTIFVSFIISKKDLPFATPEEIHRWAASFYKKAFPIPSFDLLENDYVIGNLKCGGNAQYLQKNRWLHHTSFLFDFDPKQMQLLALPKKAPSYRKNRDHKEFLISLKTYFASKEDFLYSIRKTLHSYFDVKEKELKDIEELCKMSHRKSTALLSS